nr:unnamed protein product [Digitaria exilis]
MTRDGSTATRAPSAAAAGPQLGRRAGAAAPEPTASRSFVVSIVSSSTLPHFAFRTSPRGGPHGEIL